MTKIRTLPQRKNQGIKISCQFRNDCKRNLEFTYDFTNNEEIRGELEQIVQQFPEKNENGEMLRADMITQLSSFGKGFIPNLDSGILQGFFSNAIIEGVKRNLEEELITTLVSLFIGVIHLYFDGFKNGIQEYTIVIDESVQAVYLQMTNELERIMYGSLN